MPQLPMDHRITLKIAAGIIILVIALAVAVTVKDFSSRDTGSTEQANLSDEDFDIQEYIYDNESSNKTYLLVVKNNSEYTVNFDCNTTAYEQDGSFLGINYNRINSIEPGNSGCMEFNFDTEYAQKFEYELYYEVSKVSSGMDKLTATDSISGTSVNTVCTNAGTSAISYLRADILFFSGKELVSYDFSYIHNGNSEQINPGDSLSHDFDCDMDFDSYQIFYSCQDIK